MSATSRSDPRRQGTGSILRTPDGRFLMAVNPGDNSASSFAVGADGKLTLVDRKATGNVVTGSGTAKSLAYSAKSNTLYVMHWFGPEHLRLMSVDEEGELSARPERYSVVPKDKPKRPSTMAVLSPDEKFLLVGESLATPSRSRKIRHLRRFRATAPIAGCRGASAVARTTSGSHPMAPTCIRSTRTLRGWWATPSNPMGRSTRSPARTFRTTALRD